MGRINQKKLNMKKCSLLFSLFFICFIANAQSPIGTWKTIDDETKQAKSYVQIYEKNGLLYGKIIKLLTKVDHDECKNCKGVLKNKPLIGLEIMSKMKKEGDEWVDGTIVDPKSGKEYSCKFSLEGKDKLKLRGFIGFSLIGRTQYWYRVD